jgi:hypothetical protein
VADVISAGGGGVGKGEQKKEENAKGMESKKANYPMTRSVCKECTHMIGGSSAASLC